MKEAGEILRKARESRNLSLHEIGMSLKINPKTLQAIESGDESKLPPKTFLRGFIKSYAQFLKLDVNEVLRASQEVTVVQVPTDAAPTESAMAESSLPAARETATVATPVTPKSAPTPVAMPKVTVPERNNKFDKANTLDNLKSQAVTPRRKLMIGLIITMIIAIALVARLVNKYQRERVPEHSKEAQTTPIVPADPTAQAPLDDANVTGPTNGPPPGVSTASPTEMMTPAATTPAVSTTKPDVTPAPTPEAKPAAKVETKPEPKAEPKPEPKAKPEVKPVVKAETKPEAKPEPKPQIKTDAAATTATEDTPVVEITKPQEVIVEALNNVTINYILGDGKPGSITLVPDQIHTFKSKQIQLEISDGGAVSIIVNGRERGVPGKIGKAMTLNYPK